MAAPQPETDVTDFDRILERAAAEPDASPSAGTPNAAFAYDDWLEKLSSAPDGGSDPAAVQHLIADSHASAIAKQRSLALSAPAALDQPAAAAAQATLTAPAALHASATTAQAEPQAAPSCDSYANINHSSDPAITIMAPSHPPPVPHWQPEVVPPPAVAFPANGPAERARLAAEAASEAGMLSNLQQLESELAKEKEARRTQAFELSSLHRQVDHANGELARLQHAQQKLESEASEWRASEQSMRKELREETTRGSRDGAVIRALQQREATLLAQLSGALRSATRPLLLPRHIDQMRRRSELDRAMSADRYRG